MWVYPTAIPQISEKDAIIKPVNEHALPLAADMEVFPCIEPLFPFKKCRSLLSLPLPKGAK